ncbi:MAG: hypothetical protein MK209_00540 [Planctomycetes bacterium]|nr:hypothetical protein [Planctomycetota bacterium]
MPHTLSDMPDELVTTLLAANFDAASLANRLADHGVRVSAESPHLFSYAQKLLRTEPQLASSISAFLDRMHAERITEVHSSELDLLRAWAVCADWRRCRDFGGVFWAFARDPRPGVRVSTRLLVQRLLQHALRPACRG